MARSNDDAHRRGASQGRDATVPRIAANLTMLFTEYPFIERFSHAAQTGLTAVEFMFPYDEDVDAIKQALDQNDLTLVLFNTPAGNWAAGERGIACQPERIDEYRAGVQTAKETGQALGVPRINTLVGIPTPGEDATTIRTTIVENLRYAAEQFGEVGIRALVEPVNNLDIASFALPTAKNGLDIINEVNHPNLALQLDVYHALRMGEDPFALITHHIDQIGHIQIADVPGRHQPGTGEIDFGHLFEVIDASGYDGWVSLEYNPEGPTEEGFDLMRQLGVLPDAPRER